MKVDSIKKVKADVIAFFICLATSIGLTIGGFFAPPMGVIDGSVITASGILLGFATLAVGAQALQDGVRAGKQTKFQHGNTSVVIGKKENEESAEK